MSDIPIRALHRIDQPVPLDGLDQVGLDAVALWEAVREDQGTERVAPAVSTMRVKLSSRIVGVLVDVALVDETSDLDVSRGD